MSRAIYLSAGHSNVQGRDQGAIGNGYIEGHETVRIRNRVSTILRQTYGVKAVVDNDNSILSETIKFFQNLVGKNSLLVEWHFNAATPKATGTETFVPDDCSKTELQLAECFSHSAHVRFNIPKRGMCFGYSGVKPESESARKKLGWMRLLGENILPEVCFISNKFDMTAYERNFEDYCQDCALILYKFSKNQESEILSKFK